ncbi:MAG: GDSL-type esterase/lipase family protein, partial [Thermoanaerobaculia bacterium]
VAFGDSITEGHPPYDDRGGYPSRLESLLRREDREVEVRNRGLGGETTSEGLSRLPGVLAEGGDVLLLMEGSNDVSLIVTGELSPETVIANLAAMGSRAKQAGFGVVLATIIPRGPHTSRDQNNGATFGLDLEIRDLAYRRRDPLVEGWEVFFHHLRPYSTIYYDGPEDDVGHPNAEGFDVLAAAFADVLQGRDTMWPVIGEFLPNPFLDPEVRPGQIFEVTVYDFGTGLERTASTLTLNDVVVATDAAGNPGRQLLSHTSDATTVTCFARLGVLAVDRNDPPNRLDSRVADYEVQGGSYRRSDVNRDCRVDGRDVVTLGRVFGLPRGELGFDSDFDVNGDGRLDGDDLAAIARTFGLVSF